MGKTMNELEALVGNQWDGKRIDPDTVREMYEYWVSVGETDPEEDPLEDYLRAFAALPPGEFS